MTEQVDKTTEMSREEKIDRLDYVARRKYFIRTFEENGGGLDDDCLTKTEIFKHFKLNSEEDFVKLMKENEESFEEIMGDVYQLVVKSKREKIKNKLEEEWNVLKDRIGKNDTKSIDVIHSGNSQITILSEALKQIHPVQDFFEGNAYTTVILPYMEKREVSEGIFNEITSNGKFLINNNRESPILLNKNAMKKGIGKNIYLKVFPEFLEPRWEMRSVVSFLNGSNPHYTLEEIFNEIKAHIKYYVQLEEEGQYDVVACWIIATYFFEMFDAFGYLYLTGTKGCGKTKLLKTVATLAFNGKLNIGIKSASLFRSVHGSKLTLCLDEIDANTLKNDTDLNELLRGGYIKGHTVPRTERNEKTGVFEVKQHELFSPKALCNITGIDDVIEDRAITIVMVRSDNKELSNRDVNMNDYKWQQTRNKLYLFMMEKFKDIDDKRKMIIDSDTVSVFSADTVVILNRVTNYENESIVVSSKKEGVINNDTNYTYNTNNTNNNNTLYIHNNSIEEGIEGGIFSGHNDDVVSVVSKDSGVSAVSAVSGDILPKDSRMSVMAQRNFQIALPVLTIASGVNEQVYKDVYDCLFATFERKRNDMNFESNDNSLLEAVVSMVDTRRWYKISSFSDSMKASTEEGWSNPKWVGRALKRIFPLMEKRRMPAGHEVLLSPEMVRARATKNGLNVDEILSNANYNVLECMSDIEKIKYKVKKEDSIFDYQLMNWAIEQGVPETKAESIIQQLKNTGFLMEIRSGLLKWALK